MMTHAKTRAAKKTRGQGRRGRPPLGEPKKRPSPSLLPPFFFEASRLRVRLYGMDTAESPSENPKRSQPAREKCSPLPVNPAQPYRT